MNREELVQKGIYTEYKKTKALLYKNNYNIADSTLYTEPVKKNFEELQKLERAIKNRKYNNRIEIEKWLFYINKNAYYKYDLIFLTLTFDDNALEKIQKKYRKEYITRFLRNSCIKYQANIDYGKDGREHYHAIGLINRKIDYSLWQWRINGIKIPRRTKDQKKIHDYIFKLNNHSFKNSTRQERIIKDRNKDFDKILDDFIKKNKKEWELFKIVFRVESYA